MSDNTETDTKNNGKLALPSTLYDVAKDVTTIYLPATASLYFGLAQIWGWPVPENVTGSIALIVTFLGIVLKISTNSYNKSTKSTDGMLKVDTSDPQRDTYLLDITTDLSELPDKDRITLKVQDVTPQDEVSSMDPRNVVRKNDSQN